MKQVKTPAIGSVQPQALRIRSEYLRAVREGKKRTTIRKGKLSINPGLLLLECGSERQIVNVIAVQWHQVKTLTTEHAIADGFQSIDELREALRTIYPDLKYNHYVTVIEFDTFINTPSS
ncbi:MAG: ASCH domain-containing protein [Aggregatilineales bacterium]